MPNGTKGRLGALLCALLTAIVFSNLSFAVPAQTTQVFTLQPNAQTYIVTPGQAASVTVTVNTNGSGFSGYLSYTCSDTAPESICIAPALPVSSSSAASFTVTTAPPITGSLHRLVDRTQTFYAALLPGLLGIVFTVSSRKRFRRGMSLLAMILTVSLSTVWLSSCGNSINGSSRNPGTAKGNYPITITATATSGSDDGATGQAQVTLSVQ